MDELPSSLQVWQRLYWLRLSRFSRQRHNQQMHRREPMAFLQPRHLGRARNWVRAPASRSTAVLKADARKVGGRTGENIDQVGVPVREESLQTLPHVWQQKHGQHQERSRLLCLCAISGWRFTRAVKKLRCRAYLLADQAIQHQQEYSRSYKNGQSIIPTFITTRQCPACSV